MSLRRNKGDQEAIPKHEAQENVTSEKLKLKDKIYSKIKPFKIVVPIEFSLKSVIK